MDRTTNILDAVVVYNPRSGKAYSRTTLGRLCRKHGIAVSKFIEIQDGYEKKLRPYIKRDQVIITVGGDGTLSSVASLVIGAPVLFAPLPGGTLNHFTKDLGIPQDIDEALARVVRAKPRRIDVAKINDTVFLNNSSIGLYPSSLRVREDLEKGLLGKWPAAVLAGIQAFARYRVLTVTIEGETFKTPFVFVGNNEYHLGDPATAGRTSLNKGQLSVYAITTSKRWKLFRIFRHAITGTLGESEEFKAWHTSTLTVKTKKSTVHISRDGELERVVSPLRYEILPKALRVLL